MNKSKLVVIVPCSQLGLNIKKAPSSSLLEIEIYQEPPDQDIFADGLILDLDIYDQYRDSLPIVPTLLVGEHPPAKHHLHELVCSWLPGTSTPAHLLNHQLSFLHQFIEQQKARHYQERLELLIELFQGLDSQDNLPDLLTFIIASVTRLMNSDRSTLFLVDHKTNELYSQIAEGMGTKEIRFPVGIGIAGSVAAKKETVLIPDAYQDDRFNPAFDKATGYRTRNILCMPMCNFEDKVIGVIQVLNKLDGDFREEDVILLSTFNSLAGTTIESVMFFEESQLLTDQLQQALRDNELLLENIQDGFCLLDREGKIRPGYSYACERLFGELELSGKSLLDLPLEPMDQQSEEFFKEGLSWLQLGWDRADLEGWEDLSQEKLFRVKNNILKISFRRVFNESNVVAIMASLEDFTRNFELEKQVEYQEYMSRVLFEIVQAIGRVGKSHILNVISRANHNLQVISKYFEVQNKDLNWIRKIFGEYHSLKGLLQNVGFDSFADKVHREEEYWHAGLGNQDTFSRNHIESRKHEFTQICSGFDECFQLMLKLYPDLGTEIPEDLDSLDTPGPSYQFTFQTQNTGFEQVSQLLKAEVMLLAEQMDREVSWKTPHRSLEIPPGTWKLVRNVIIHLLKNSLDHGLEDPEDRVKQGKDRAGEIFFDYRLEEECQVFEFKDDGKGIDPEFVYSRAIEKGILEPGSTLCRKDKLRLIFHPGFSTREEVGEYSGRGIGMDVVRELVEEELGGVVQLESQPGVGSRILLRIPL